MSRRGVAGTGGVSPAGTRLSTVAMALPRSLKRMIAEGWTVADPAALNKIGLSLDDAGRLQGSAG